MAQNKIRGNTQIKDKTVTRDQLNESVFTPGGEVFVDMEDHSSECNGSNTVFTLAYTPIAASVHVFLRGTLRRQGDIASGGEYTISGNDITFHSAPAAGSDLLISYRKQA